MANNKVRRQSGYYTPKPTISKKELIENDLFVNEEYNEWRNFRDGFRNWFDDSKTIKKIQRYLPFFKGREKKIKMNEKQKKLLKRRKTRKNKRFK